MRHPEEANGTAGDIDSGIRSSGDTRQEGRGGRNGERRLRRMGVCGEREKVRKREPPPLRQMDETETQRGKLREKARDI
ncbi:hypothetical protein VTO73DRAFT_13346 [Trametes versicolor]